MSDEWNELADCVECGATIRPATERAFTIDDGVFLCFDCAVERGGVYDGNDERWTVVPFAAPAPAE
jgi:hypothetical protein